MIARNVFRLTTVLVPCLVSAGVAGAQGAVSGRVIDAASRLPVAGASIHALGSGGREPGSAVSGADGRFRLVNLPPGTYVVGAQRIGFLPRYVQNVSVGTDGVVEVEIEMTPSDNRLGEVVVTAVAGPTLSLHSPVSDHRAGPEVVEGPALSVSHYVPYLPGVQSARTGVIQSTVVARGFSNVFSGAIRAMSDFRLASVPSLSLNAFYLIPVANEDIETIEMVLGPASAIYGPNSAGGVIHILSKSPFDSRGTTVSLSGGERDALRAALRHAWASDRVGIRVSGHYTRAEDWHVRDPVEDEARADSLANGGSPSMRIGRRDFAVERLGGELRTDVRIGDSTTLIGGVGSTLARSAIEMTGLGAAQVEDWRYDYYQLRLHSGRLFAQAYLNTSDAGDSTFLLRTGQSIVDRSTMLAGQIRHGFDLGERQTFVYGLDAQRTNPRTGGTITGRNEGRDGIEELGGYLHSETRPSPLIDLIAAVRVDRHNRLDDMVFSPRAAVVLKPRDGHAVRLTYNRAYSTPNTNHLFLDLESQSTLGGLPFGVRAIGVPDGGLQFWRDCAGGVGDLCMRSPFAAAGADPGTYTHTEASRYWQTVAQILYEASNQQIDIRSVPVPSPSQVGTVIRVLNPTTRLFDPVQASGVRDVDPLRPTISSVIEAGYKGFIGDRLSLTVDVYHERKNDFIGPLIVETPNAFMEQSSVAAYLEAVGYPAAVAGAIAAEVTRVPVGTVVPTSSLTDKQEIILTYRNFGAVDLWGSDLGAHLRLSDRFTATGSYSFVSDDFFPRSEVGGLADIALNAPKHRGSLGLRFADTEGISLGGTVRYAAAFPMSSGVYVGDVDDLRQLDLSLGYRIGNRGGGGRETLFSIDAQNVLDQRRSQFVGAPPIGRFIMTKVQVTF